jgi:integrase/recombinase XerD
VSALAGHLEDYLRMRRALGFELGRHGQTLPGFVAYLEAAGASTVTVDLAVAWARLPEQRIKPLTVCFRLSAVRGFARYLHAIDPANQIPPSGLLAVPRRRPAPYLYAPGELARLLQTTRRLRPPLRAATHRTLIGLLAATGMRLGEALALTRGDVDLADGVITIRHAKFDRMRLVPLHPSVTAALRGYTSVRGRLCPAPCTDRFFVSATGRTLRREEADQVFRVITGLTGLRTGTVRPRIHDLRHSFAVRTLIDGQREGADVSALLPVLPAYLGHVEPANTYWYLSAVPELMQLAATRLEQHETGRS